MCVDDFERKMQKFNLETRVKISSKEDKLEIASSKSELIKKFPYLIDALEYACSYFPEKILRQDIEDDTHYNLLISKKEFFSFSNNKKALEKEIFELSRKPEIKKFPLNEKYRISTQPIIIKCCDFENEIGFIFEFYKPLFESFLFLNLDKDVEITS